MSKLSLLFPGLDLNGEWSGDFSGEASTLHNHLVTVPSHFPRSISLSFSLSLSFILHPFHLPPACQHLHNWASIFLSIAPFLLLRPFPPSSSPPITILVMPGPPLLCQCVWLKCSPGRNKICDENFIVSAFKSLCSDSLCWRRRDVVLLSSLFFLSWWFLAPVATFLSGCFWMETWHFSVLNYIKSLLGF